MDGAIGQPAPLSTVQIGSTPYSPRCAAMKATSTGVGGRAPPRRKPTPTSKSLRPAQLGVLLLQRLDLLMLNGGQPGTLPTVDLGPPNHFRKVSADPIPSFWATATIAAYSEG